MKKKFLKESSAFLSISLFSLLLVVWIQICTYSEYGEVQENWSNLDPDLQYWFMDT